MCSRSSHNNNAKLANRTVNKCLDMSSQVNGDIHPESAAAQYLADNPQLVNVVCLEILAYVMTITVGISF